MKHFMLLAALALLVTVPIAGQSGRGGRGASMAAPGASQLKFHVDEDFFKLPDTIRPSEAVGVALNSKGRIFLLSRGNHPLLEFGPDGSFIRSIGDGSTIFHAAHSVRFDADDSMWLVDSGNNVVVNSPFTSAPPLQRFAGHRSAKALAERRFAPRSFTLG